MSNKPRQIPWAADPHTKAKHALYDRYLSKWSPIMLRGWGANITYAEGFAGPGVYQDGAPGSPVIALRSVVGDAELRSLVARGRMRFIFIDHEPRCIEILHTEVAKAVTPVALEDLSNHGFDLTIERGDCDPALDNALTRSGAWGRPILAVLDTWGGSVPAALVAKVANNGNSEVIITMQPQYFLRFAQVEEIGHGDKVFGDQGWRRVAEQPSAEKERWLLQRYRSTIRNAGFTHVLDFELVDHTGQSLYLIFGTSHERGLQKMKEAMWEVDPVGGVGYRDPRDPGQQTLEIELEPQTAPLRRLIRAHLETQPEHSATIIALRKFALYQTIYKESQVLPVVRDMLADGEIAAPGAQNRVPSFSDTVILHRLVDTDAG
ncbi:MAG TPA: three-Cys-motif partner protein TcmP [Nocardioides sp.]|uniref:three-Cys-motif partner protein TcmP n=1 Tax=uncultured Nocardioides sp. TaxID=198441 RepID=UPI000EDD38AF|nr:three-Cys-motif partner protein TcmP [uncultured Nocardioides sp.]HCB03181.1 hypothetical protein [Nocardioides sp.]HRD59513.1 three-Cys-motif partner protein TcmP [Nocardioides sp.]HRI94990.1 three-Cys-motif partner protein TcmP [Nocardioides sp.]HRK44751.1 three-Cys-motif partner protein TcmP [Nocardioides sp.]